MIITGQETLKQYYELAGIREHSYMVDQGMQTLLDRTFGAEAFMKAGGGKGFADIPVGELLDTFFAAWDKQSIFDGMQFLADHLAQDKVFHDIYTQDEIAQDPTRKETGLAVFPVPGKKPCVLICPGGGYYSVCALPEGYAIAKAVNELGYNACVLVYRVGAAARYPHPMEDLVKAVDFLTLHSAETGIDFDEYTLMGFSAGGHLAASFGTQSLGYAKYKVKRPGSLVLAYPVITMGQYAHAGSREHLLGKDRHELAQWQMACSVEKQITPEYPPTYIWQCEEDPSVPIQNSRMLAEQLQKHSVPYVYQTWPGAAHGWGLGTGTAAEGWLKTALGWQRNAAGNIS